MNEEIAKQILKGAADDTGLFDCSWYLAWDIGDDTACLDGDFTVDELEAIAWWMRNKKK